MNLKFNKEQQKLQHCFLFALLHHPDLNFHIQSLDPAAAPHCGGFPSSHQSHTSRTIQQTSFPTQYLFLREDEKGEEKKKKKQTTQTNQTTCSQPSHKGRCSQKLTGTSWCGGEGRWLCALCPQLLPTAVTETLRCCSRAQPGTCSMSRKSSGGL